MDIAESKKRERWAILCSVKSCGMKQRTIEKSLFKTNDVLLETSHLTKPIFWSRQESEAVSSTIEKKAAHSFFFLSVTSHPVPVKTVR